MKRAAFLLLLAVALLVPRFTQAWGREGHQVIAAVAQERLTPATKAAVYDLLHTSMISVATWGDDIRNQRPETARWHYVDIPLSAQHYDPTRDCQDVPGQGDCIIAAIDRFVAVLRDPSRPTDERVEALKYVIHFVGDVHCPAHAEDDHDRGGNGVRLTFFGQATNLHSVWDSRLIRQAGFNTTSLTEAVEKLKIDVKPGGTLVEWAEESHDVARDVAYKIPQDHVLDQDYLDAAMPALELQLLRGGVRLAGLLNDIFDPHKAGAAVSQTPSQAPAVAKPAAAKGASQPATPKGASLSGLVASEPFHGNVRSKVYHAPGCANYNCPNCTAIFHTKEEAEKAGYRPDKACVR
jgi:hypothetical protein